jgi:hypothetical protein
MATINQMGPLGLFQHRRWEDIALMILGAAIMISPMFVEAGNTTIVAATALVGAALVVLGGVEQLALRRWEEFLVLLGGLWMMASPFILSYGAPLRNWHIVLGAAVAILALLELWQDRNRDLES